MYAGPEPRATDIATFVDNLPLRPAAAKMASMQLVINGESQASPAATLSALVAELGMKPDRVAIELNREIVPRDQWPSTALHEGDQLEIVQFVGGGSALV